MYRATTPAHTFTVPFETEHIDKVIITYSQKGNVVLEKREDEVIMDKNTINVLLSQEETALFDPDLLCEIQLRVKIDDRVFASNIHKCRVNEVLNDEVM